MMAKCAAKKVSAVFPLPGTYSLGINQERTGLLVYEVPAEEKDFSISYLEAFEEGDEGNVFFVYFTPEER